MGKLRLSPRLHCLSRVLAYPASPCFGHPRSPPGLSRVKTQLHFMKPQLSHCIILRLEDTTLLPTSQHYSLGSLHSSRVSALSEAPNVPLRRVGSSVQCVTVESRSAFHCVPSERVCMFDVGNVWCVQRVRQLSNQTGCPGRQPTSGSPETPSPSKLHQRQTAQHWHPLGHP